MISLVPLHQVQPAAIESLLDTAFGTDRHGRTAYRIRTGMAPLDALSFAAMEGGRLLATLQSWPIELVRDTGAAQPLVMIGPVAVLPDRQRDGIGKRLMSHMLSVADGDATGDSLMLIGDPEYYGRFFGFSAERTGLWRAPGPVEQHRLLARGRNVPADAGVLGPRGLVRA